MEAAPCTCARAILVPTDFCTAPYSPVSNRVLNLSAIGPAVLEIWQRPLHVRTCNSTPPVAYGYALPGMGAYLYAKFQCNRPSSYRDIAIVIKLTLLRIARGTCIRGHPHASRIVQYLVEGMKLPYKNCRKSIAQVLTKISAFQKRYLCKIL